MLFFVPLFQIFSMPHSAPFQKNALTKFQLLKPSKLQGYEGRKANEGGKVPGQFDCDFWGLALLLYI
jgi:hypothetical protein